MISRFVKCFPFNSLLLQDFLPFFFPSNEFPSSFSVLISTQCFSDSIPICQYFLLFTSFDNMFDKFVYCGVVNSSEGIDNSMMIIVAHSCLIRLLNCKSSGLASTCISVGLPCANTLLPMLVLHIFSPIRP